MTDESTGPTALVKRVTSLAANLPASAVELMERIRAIREVAHVLSPAMSAASIPPYIKINTVVEVIDTKFDPRTGRGNDIYFQASIHKSQKSGRGDDATFEPLEGSLNATAIKRVIAALGVNVKESKEIHTGEENHWKWQSVGKIRDFDGSWRDLPPGTADIDLRDGSPQIGEWTPEEWAKRDKAAIEKAAKLPDREKWKAKPEPIGGWTKERVMGARRFGLRLAEAKSLNALGRNCGLKQVYSLAELQKPFVCFRATFEHDTKDPEIKRMLSAAELGASNLLGYPAPALPPVAEQEQVSHHTDDAIDGETVSEPVKAGPTQPAAVPFDEEPEPPNETTKAAEPTFHITGVFASGGNFFLKTAELPDLPIWTDDKSTAQAAVAAKKANTELVIEMEKRGNETWLIGFSAAEKL